MAKDKYILDIIDELEEFDDNEIEEVIQDELKKEYGLDVEHLDLDIENEEK